MKLVQLKHNRQIEHPIYYLSVHPTTNLAEVTSIRYICNIRIRWEKYKNPRKITQCYRCQSMGHGSGNCHRKPKCVKCGEEHLTTECLKERDKPTKCAHCAGPHTANAPTCEYYMQHLQKIQNNRTRNSTNNVARSTPHQQEAANYPPPQQQYTAAYPSLQQRYAAAQQNAWTDPQKAGSRENRYTTDHTNQQLHLNHNKTYSTMVRNTNTNNNHIEIESQNEDSQMSNITELFNEMKKLNALCDIKSMIKLLKNLNSKLENCFTHYERC